MRRPAVVVLFDPCGPAAVARFVIAAVVSAIKSVSWRRPRPHIGQESGEVVSPAFTNPDPAASIVLEVPQIGIRTSLVHVSPRDVFGRVLAAAAAVTLGIAVTESASACGFTSPAPTGASIAASKRPNTDSADGSAIAAASPKHDMLSVWVNLDPINKESCQAAKSLSGEVEALSHAPFYHSRGAIIMRFSWEA